jgi:hypothetical protein
MHADTAPACITHLGSHNFRASTGSLVSFGRVELGRLENYFEKSDAAVRGIQGVVVV